MKIIVFGTKRCKFCKVQQSYLKDRFNDEDWLYVDVVKDVENLKIAASVNIDNLPTIVLLSERNEEIFRKEGTMASDQIFHMLNVDSIPVDDSVDNKIMLSYDPKLKRGDIVKACKLNGKYLYDVKIKSCKCISTESKTIKPIEKKAYIEKGGRKDLCWIVNFLPIERDEEGCDAG